MANKWLKSLKKADDILDFDFNPHAMENTTEAPTPYFGWMLASPSNKIPSGANFLFGAEPKSGKSLLAMSMVNRILESDPTGESVAIYINSEGRAALQGNLIKKELQDRVIMKDSNDPVAIFDWLHDDVRPMVVDDKMPLKIIVIDSLSSITGIKRQAAESVAQHLMGDQAMTLQLGLQRLNWLRRNNIHLVATVQMRANMEAGSYGPKSKFQASFAVRHYFDYFISLSRAGAADDKKNVFDQAYEDSDLKDARGNKLLNGHKIYMKVTESSIGPAGRSGVITMSYDSGIVDTWEEIYLLGKNLGIAKTENNRTYEFQGQKFNGKKELAMAIRDNDELGKAILSEVRKLDAHKI